MSDDLPPVLPLADLHDRHYGLTEAIATSFAEAAAICMQRHHSSPRIINVRIDGDEGRDYLVLWDEPTDRHQAAWANQDDATRDGAYAVVVAAVETHLGYFVVGRARTGSGSDFLVSTQPYGHAVDPPNPQEADVLRLEVSGIDRCVSDSYLDGRVQDKLRQLRNGRSALPGVAGVVAFDLARVRFAKL
jgi:hypothetical protein